jgi:hypothetical protein
MNAHDARHNPPSRPSRCLSSLHFQQQQIDVEASISPSSCYSLRPGPTRRNPEASHPDLLAGVRKPTLPSSRDHHPECEPGPIGLNEESATVTLRLQGARPSFQSASHVQRSSGSACRFQNASAAAIACCEPGLTIIATVTVAIWIPFAES